MAIAPNCLGMLTVIPPNEIKKKGMPHKKEVIESARLSDEDKKK